MRTLIKHAKHGFKHKPYHMTFLGVLFFGVTLVFGVILYTISSFAAPTPPFSLSPPPISGVAAVGQQMTVDPGGWTGNPTFTYQWQRCDQAGSNCVNISGATVNTYTLTVNEANYTVRAVVTATEASLSTDANSELSQVVQPQLGDINTDGVINLFDLGMLLGKWQSQTNITQQDLNNDGVVSQLDLNILLGMYIP